MTDGPLPRDQTPVRVAPAATPGTHRLAHVGDRVVVVAGLYLGREVLVPITLAVLLSPLLAPLANLLQKARLGRELSAILAAALAIGVILAGGGLIGTQIAGLASDVPRYQTTIERKIDALRSSGSSLGPAPAITSFIRPASPRPTSFR